MLRTALPCCAALPSSSSTSVIRPSTSAAGFTMVELLVAVMVMGMLLVMVLDLRYFT